VEREESCSVDLFSKSSLQIKAPAASVGPSFKKIFARIFINGFVRREWKD